LLLEKLFIMQKLYIVKKLIYNERVLCYDSLQSDKPLTEKSSL